MRHLASIESDRAAVAVLLSTRLSCSASSLNVDDCETEVGCGHGSVSRPNDGN